MKTITVNGVEIDPNSIAEEIYNLMVKFDEEATTLLGCNTIDQKWIDIIKIQLSKAWVTLHEKHCRFYYDDPNAFPVNKQEQSSFVEDVSKAVINCVINHQPKPI